MPREIHAAPSGPAPIGPYSIATEAHGLVFVSGQVAIDASTGTPTTGDAAAQARTVLENLGAILGDLDLHYDDVVKATIFLASIRDFPIVNDVYSEFFGGNPPARSTVEVGALPGGYLVEIEVIAAR